MKELDTMTAHAIHAVEEKYGVRLYTEQELETLQASYAALSQAAREVVDDFQAILDGNAGGFAGPTLIEKWHYKLAALLPSEPTPEQKER